MKKQIFMIAVVLVVCLLAGLAAMLLIPWSNPGKPTNMILNKDQSYGGSLSEKKYGKGAPLNGEYDVENSPYYTVNNDYFNMPSTQERIIFPKFRSYQQTMRSSCGVCAVNGVLSYYGEEGDPYEMEESYVKLYEELNKKTIYGYGSSTSLHKVTLAELGYECQTYGSKTATAPQFPTYEGYMEFVRTNLKAGKPVVVATYLGSGHYLTVIGLF